MKYIKEELEIIVKDVLSTAEVCRRLNIRPVGGNYKTLKKYFKLYEIDTSHFTGQAWNVGDRFTNFSLSYTLEEICIENSTYTNTSTLRKRLVREGVKNNKCEECGIENWCNKILSFHLDHVNGNNMDNRIENLRILCPNCHSQTETYCNGSSISSKSEVRKDKYSNRTIEYKVVKPKNINYCSCGVKIKRESKFCIKCAHINQQKVERPSIEQLKIDIKELGYCGAGRKYGVSDNSIRKWIKLE